MSSETNDGVTGEAVGLSPTAAPPLAVAYADPTTERPTDDRRVRVGRWLARASWITLLVAWGAGIACEVMKKESPAAAQTVLQVGVWIAVGGFGCAIVALCGMPWWGRKRVLWQSMISVVIMGGLMTAGVMKGLSQNKARAARAVAARQQAGALARGSLAESGWVVAALTRNGGTVMAVGLRDDAPGWEDVHDALRTPVGIASMTIENASGSSDLTVDTAGGHVIFADGSKLPLPDAAGMMPAFGPDRLGLSSTAAPPFKCAAGQTLGGRLVVLPAGLDAHAVRGIELKVNGEDWILPGRFFTAEEKKGLFHFRSAPPGQEKP